MVELTGSSSKLVFQPLPVDDPTRRCPDITLAKKHLNWHPTVDLCDRTGTDDRLVSHDRHGKVPPADAELLMRGQCTVRYGAIPVQNASWTNRQLNDLFASSWNDHEERDFQPVLKRSLGYVGAFEADRLVGFVNVACDGGQHAFVLDTTVIQRSRGKASASRLVKEAAELARQPGPRGCMSISSRG